MISTLAMIGRAILRAFRGLCLICSCLLAIAVVLAVLEVAASSILPQATGCYTTEILPSFACGEGWARRSMEVVLDLPFLFLYALAFALSPHDMPPSGGVRLLIYFFDAILVLALIHPLRFLLRKSGRGNN